MKRITCAFGIIGILAGCGASSPISAQLQALRDQGGIRRGFYAYYDNELHPLDRSPIIAIPANASLVGVNLEPHPILLTKLEPAAAKDVSLEDIAAVVSGAWALSEDPTRQVDPGFLFKEAKTLECKSIPDVENPHDVIWLESTELEPGLYTLAGDRFWVEQSKFCQTLVSASEEHEKNGEVTAAGLSWALAVMVQPQEALQSFVGFPKRMADSIRAEYVKSNWEAGIQRATQLRDLIRYASQAELKRSLELIVEGNFDMEKPDRVIQRSTGLNWSHGSARENFFQSIQECIDQSNVEMLWRLPSVAELKKLSEDLQRISPKWSEELVAMNVSLPVEASIDYAWTCTGTSSWSTGNSLDQEGDRLLVSNPVVSPSDRLPVSFIGRHPVEFPTAGYLWLTEAEAPLLFWASAMGHLSMVKTLLAAKADPNIVTDGYTALTVSLLNGHYDIVRDLLAADALGNINSSGALVSPLDAALLTGDLELANALLAHGAPLVFASTLPFDGRLQPSPFELVRRGDAAMLQFLAEKGAKLSSIKDTEGRTLLLECARVINNPFDTVRGDTRKTRTVQDKVLRVLVSQGCDLAYEDPKGSISAGTWLSSSGIYFPKDLEQLRSLAPSVQ